MKTYTKLFTIGIFIIFLLMTPIIVAADPINEEACWGQATAVFAQSGVMGEHASQEPTPRLGLARLARLLYEAGLIGQPSIQALGAFVAAELGLSIDACM